MALTVDAFGRSITTQVINGLRVYSITGMTITPVQGGSLTIPQEEAKVLDTFNNHAASAPAVRVIPVDAFLDRLTNAEIDGMPNSVMQRLLAAGRIWLDDPRLINAISGLSGARQTAIRA